MGDTILASKADDPTLTRRSLLKWTAAVGAATTMLGTSGCAGFNQVELSETSAEGDADNPGEWIPCSCWADCGSRGFNKALVRDGEVLRMGTDQSHDDSPDCPQLRACARGRALRGMIFGADRIKYPMKRKSWQPGGGENAHGDLRGKDEWERISWDEALDLIAGEIKRVIETYGNEGVLLPGGVPAGFGDYDIGRLMYLLGGCLEQYGSVSSGAWWPMASFIGLPEEINDRMDLRTSELIVMWGYNPAWSRAGMPTYDLQQCKLAGARFVSVDVNFNSTARTLTDDFVAVRPSTDAAMMIAMCYVLLDQDDPAANPLIDWEFLDHCCVGFDAEHMPEDADPKGNFKDYVLGTYDGIPKTPEWASRICGAPAADIERLALDMAKADRCALIMAPAAARTGNGAQLCQALLSFGAMAGLIGKPGCCAASDCGHSWMMGGYETLHKGGTFLGDPHFDTLGGPEYVPNPLLHKQINTNEMWTSYLDQEPYTAEDGQRYENKVHLIYDRKDNFLNQGPGTMLGIEVYRSVDTVVAQNLVMTPPCQYADIVLPVSSMWERYGMFDQAYRETMIWTSQVCEPLFECKSDIDIALELGDRLGVDRAALCPVDGPQMVVNMVAAAQILNEDGETWDNLVTITDEDLAELGVDGTPQEGLVPILDLKREGIYTIPRTPDDGLNFVPLQAFREDPEGNPLATATGKLELYCAAAVDYANRLGFQSQSPIAVYEPAPEGYEATFANWETGEKGEYPFQVVNWHILRHSHSTFAEVPNLREAFDHPLYMNPLDADGLGLKTGDTVLVTSPWGRILRPLLVVDTLMPGVVGLGQGAWVEIDEETGIDKGGCANVLCGPNATSCGWQAWNSCIAKVEKWDGEALEPDCKWDSHQVFKED